MDNHIGVILKSGIDDTHQSHKDYIHTINGGSSNNRKVKSMTGLILLIIH